MSHEAARDRGEGARTVALLGSALVFAMALLTGGCQVEVRGTRDRDIPIVEVVDGVERVTINLADPPTRYDTDLLLGPDDTTVISPQLGDTYAVTLRLTPDTTLELDASDIGFNVTAPEGREPRPADSIDDVTIGTQPTPEQAIEQIAETWPVLGATPDDIARAQQAVRDPGNSVEPDRSIEAFSTEIDGVLVGSVVIAERDYPFVAMSYDVLWRLLPIPADGPATPDPSGGGDA